ncbi:MAG TPA: DotU family type IV/VI secretion system protein [Phycisphaerae bacterium]|nr:DotU family type IV/VI secretion system protein [Phycisphaerae bacterium]
MTEQTAQPSLRLTESCWPVFEFLVNFRRQVKHGNVPDPDAVRYEALSALRDAEDLARNDPVTERGWDDHIKGAMVYLLDYVMINTDWSGRDYWFDNPFETDPEIVNHAQALGGEEFFRDCDELQREYELAERRDRRDKDELAEQLSLYFIVLRLGFKGQFHDRPQELADYTRRLFSRLPAYASTRAKEMFPDAYRHNQELKITYSLGASLTVVLAIFVVVIGLSLFTFRMAWERAVGDIRESATAWVEARDAGGDRS